MGELKGSGRSPTEALNGLEAAIVKPWKRAGFESWAVGYDSVEFVKEPAGRRVKGDVPDSVEQLICRLIAAMAPLADDYPMPYFRVKK